MTMYMNSTSTPATMILTIVLLLSVNLVRCEYCVMENVSRDTHKEWKLITNLLKNYDVAKSPANVTKVVLRFILKSFYFDSEETVFTIHGWAFFKWEDERLKWDPNDYDGISDTLLSSFLIWTPQLEHQSILEYDYYYMNSLPSCIVKNSGRVTCVPRITLQTECNSNLTNWPYDVQSCTFNMGSYKKYKDCVTLTFNSSRGITMFGAEYGPGWDIISFAKEEDPNHDKQLRMRFMVERQGVGLAAVVIVPSLVLAVLTVISLFLELDNIRLGIATMSLLGHFYFLQEINESIPKHGPTTPTVLRFATVSVIFTAIAIVLSFVLSSLRRKTEPPARWMVNINEFVLKSPGKFLIWPRWGVQITEDIEDENNESIEDWINFTNVINSGVIVIAIIMYLSTYIAFIPSALPIDYDSL